MSLLSTVVGMWGGQGTELRPSSDIGK